MRESIVGRVARDGIRNPVSDKLIVAENEIITKSVAARIEDLGLDKIRIRSPLTCEAPQGICTKCYGTDMSTGRFVEEGMAVGIIAAQSIGEPGTQLTMRTFHTGGVAQKAASENKLKATQNGIVKYHDLQPVTVPLKDGKTATVVLKRNGEILIVDEKGRELSRDKVIYGSTMHIADGAPVGKGDTLCEWDPHLTPILADVVGFVRFQYRAECATVLLVQEVGLSTVVRV